MLRFALGILLIFVWHIMAFPHPAVASENAAQVIVHPDLIFDHISIEDIRNIFLRRKTQWPNGERILPVAQQPDSPARLYFDKRVFLRSPMALRAYWNQQIFSGRQLPPPERLNDQEVIEFVSTTPGAIGYILITTKPGATRVVSTLKSEAGQTP